MKFITAEQLFDRFEGKEVLVLNDLIQAIEAEFDVSLQVVENEDENRGLDVNAMATDEEIINHIRASRADREEGRVYRGSKAIDMLNKKIGDRHRGTNV